MHINFYVVGTTRFQFINACLKLAPVVDQGVAVPGVAVRTEGGLSDATTLPLDVGLGLAHRAAEEGLGELGDEVGSPGHHPRDCDELVDVCKRLQIIAMN